MGNAAPASAHGRSTGPQTDKEPQKTKKRQEYSLPKRERDALVKRYCAYDISPSGTRGIPVFVCLSFPEFAGNKLISVLIHDFANADTTFIHQEEFLNFCAFLSPYTDEREKKRVLFDSCDVNGTGSLKYNEIFRLYKVLLGHTISDDHILALTFEVLHHPSLSTPGRITKDEFMQFKVWQSNPGLLEESTWMPFYRNHFKDNNEL